MSEAAEGIDRLMARLAEGERAVAREVFARLWPPVSRHCEAVLRGAPEAADAAQRAMVKIFERAASYDRRRPALPWALAIASWECRTSARQRTRRREEPIASQVASQLDEPLADALVERELVAAAMQALGTLSDADREVLIATYWEQSSTGAGVTMRKRRQRALRRLREAFRRLYGLD